MLSTVASQPLVTLRNVVLELFLSAVHGDVELTHLRQDNMTLLFQAVRTWRVLSSLVDAERRGRQAGSRGVKLTWRSLGQISLALTVQTNGPFLFLGAKFNCKKCRVAGDDRRAPGVE